MSETFERKITVLGEWEAGGQPYRLVNLGAGPDELQTINPLVGDEDWRPETSCYVHGILTSRIAQLEQENARLRDGHPCFDCMIDCGQEHKMICPDLEDTKSFQIF